MAIEIKQMWWHVNDISYSDYPSKRIHQVMDIFSDQSDIPIHINGEFLGLKIIGRNDSRNEIGYIWDPNGRDIILNINLNAFPDVLPIHNPNNIQNFKHLKIELEYIIWDDSVQLYPSESIFGRIRDFFSPRYISRLEFDGEAQPEFRITTPKGWQICDNGDDIATTFIWIEQNQAQILEDPPYLSFIKVENNSTTYNYLFDADGYNGPNSSGHRFMGRYLSSIDPQSLVVSVVIPIAFFVGSVALVIADILKFFPLNLNYSEYLTYFVAASAFLYVYLTYLRLGYVFPTHRYIKIGIVSVLITVVLGIILKLHPIIC